ncbi:hypothetical protein [Rhizobium binxianense]
MKVSIAILLVCSAVTGCSTDRYVDVPGHPFKTNPCCRRTKPIGEFDPRCDAPKLGFKDFCPPPVVGGAS